MVGGSVLILLAHIWQACRPRGNPCTSAQPPCLQAACLLLLLLLLDRCQL